MNLEESESYNGKIEKNLRHKKAVMLAIVLCAVLVALLFILIIMIKTIDEKTMKIYLNGSQLNMTEGEMEEFILNADGDKYLELKTLCRILGYEYNQGDYGGFNENEKSCYMANSFEVISANMDNDYFIKYLDMAGTVNIDDQMEITSQNTNGYNETFYIKKPIILERGKLYASVEEIPTMFNMEINWKNDKRLRLKSFESFINLQNITNTLNKAGYNESGGAIDGNFENLKAILDGYYVVRKESEKLAGVYDINKKELILGIKYAKVKYIQNMKEFIVTAEDGTMGLINSSGDIIIPLKNYQQVSLLDEKQSLYLVEKDKQFGVVDGEGQEIIFPEYDRIGIDVSPFSQDNVKNGKLLLDKFIPFYSENENGDTRYGLLDTNGDVDLGNYYDSFGYVSLSSNVNKDISTLLIPESEGINGIIVCWDGMYGIYDATNEKMALPAAYTRIYQSRKDGVVTYYMEYNGQTILLKDFLEENGIGN